MSRQSDDLFRPLKLPEGAIWYKGETWVPPAVELPADPAEALPGLWTFATRVWDEISVVFGGSIELMRQQAIPRKTYKLLGDWVRHLEMLVRRIIIIAALALKPVPPAKAARRPWGQGRFRRTVWCDPTTWRVSFAMLREARYRPHESRNRQESPLIRQAKGLAWRIEALRRVLSYRAAYALRYARALARWQARRAASNIPCRVGLRDWDFHPQRRTTGKHAISDGMVLAQPLARRSLNQHFEPG